MFWGLNLKANRKYTQTTSKSFHISQAALDSDTSEGGPNQIFITYEKVKFLVCTLRKDVCEQVMLDFNFAEGDEISFQSKGNGNVSLTGYIVENDMMDYMNGDEEESEIEEDEEADLRNALEMKKQLKKGAKAAMGVAEENEEEDDEDDEEEEGGDLANEEDDEEDEDDEDEEDDELDEEDDEEEEEDDDAESDEDAQPEVKKVKLDKKQNGVAKEVTPAEKKNKKNKDKQQKQQENNKQQEQKKPQKQATGERVLSGGVKVEDVRVGNGPESKVGKRVSVYYEGRLKSNNKVFDSLKNGNGFKFTVGRNEVIKGWEIGLVGMKVGGKRRITCPPHMAYGARGSPPAIPPNSTLVFDVELKAVN